MDSGSKQGYTFPFKGYDAPIDVDVLLSYEWLARHNFIVNTRRHGLSLDFLGTSNWFPGVREGEVLKVPHPVVRRVKDRSQESVPNQSTETYVVRKEFYEEFCPRLGLKPDRDCFASPEVSQCEKYFTVEQDALSRRWDQRETLWVNPALEIVGEGGSETAGLLLVGVRFGAAWKKNGWPSWFMLPPKGCTWRRALDSSSVKVASAAPTAPSRAEPGPATPTQGSGRGSP